MGRRPHSAARGRPALSRRQRGKNGAGARLPRSSVAATVGRMQTEQTWKRAAARRVEGREVRAARRPADERRPGWTTILAITVPCAVVGIAIGVGLGSAVVSPAAVAYIAAALFIAVLAFAIHLGGDTG